MDRSSSELGSFRAGWDVSVDSIYCLIFLVLTLNTVFFRRRGGTWTWIMLGVAASVLAGQDRTNQTARLAERPIEILFHFPGHE